MIHGEPVDAKRLYSAVISPEAGLAKIILAKIKDARRAEAVFCQLLPAMPGHSIPGNLPD